MIFYIRIRCVAHTMKYVRDFYHSFNNIGIHSNRIHVADLSFLRSLKVKREL